MVTIMDLKSGAKINNIYSDQLYILGDYVDNHTRKLLNPDSLEIWGYLNEDTMCNYVPISNMRLQGIRLCPFCGGTARIRMDTKQDAECHYSVKYIECNKCGCSTRKETCGGYWGHDCTDEQIIEIWNRRV